MAAETTFEALMAGVRAGDDAAETLVFRRYAGRLASMAAQQFDGPMRDRIDLDDAVNSACKSFFLRCRRDAIEVANWEALWALLMVITLRKCRTRCEYVRAARRDVGRERSESGVGDLAGLIPDRSPTPEEAVMASEMVERLFGLTEPDDRPVVELLLMGYTVEEVAHRCDCSMRTVGRVRRRAKQCLERLLAS